MTQLYLGINIQPSRDSLLDEQSKTLLKKYYCLPHEDTFQKTFARSATCYCFGDYGLAQRIYDAVSQQWFMFASPVLSNAIELDWTNFHYNWKEKNIGKLNPINELIDKMRNDFTGLPISCFLTKIDDSLSSLIDHTSELRWLSVKGGGVGGHWSDVRAVSDIAPGPIPFLKTVDSDMTAYRQGKTRKGSYAAYMNVSHPDIIEFINIRVPNGSDIHRKCLNINNAVMIDDEFLDAVVSDKQWNLVDPKTKEVRQVVSARELWESILLIRDKTGEPYIMNIDEANRHLPKYQKDLGLKIHGSNLCSEIILPTSEERTAVCCLSSFNLETYEDWASTSLVADLTKFLDNVLETFILIAPKEFAKSVFSAKQERSIGLGVMGFHSYLQKKNIAWESVSAKGVNVAIHKRIRTLADAENRVLAGERSPCPDSARSDDPRRLSHVFAIAPTSNAALIVGTSEGIEPIASNAFVKESRAGSYYIKNKYLDAIIESHVQTNRLDDDEKKKIWQSIESQNGSVQHIEFLSEHNKAVFKTAYEIDQRWIVDHARDRQQFIDQAQSVNLFFPKNANKAYVNQVHLRAFLPTGTGVPLKTLYYYKSQPFKNVEKVSQPVERMALVDGVVDTECLSCAV